MSEYQYYEWQAIDRPLTEKEIAEVNRLSSHMDVVTSTQAIVTYAWGDFKHDPQQVLLKYFDAMLYLANWGSRHLRFRFPAQSIDVERIRAYCLEDWITLTEHGAFYVLGISVDDEEGRLEWVEGEGVLGQLLAIREQIIQGDYRALYLAWLAAIRRDEPEVAEAEPEPPLPAGMQALTGSLQKLIEVLGIDPYLVQAGAASSGALESVPEEALRAALARLTREECEGYLLRVLKHEAQVDSALRKQLMELAGLAKPASTRTRRTAGDLFQAAESLEQEAKRKQQVQAEQERIQELTALAQKEESTWHWVESLIEQKQAKPYEEATALLVKLRELAVYQKKLPDFERRLAEIAERYARRPALMERFRKAGLLT